MAAEVRPTPARQPERSEAKTLRRSHQRMRPDQIHLYRNADGSDRFRVLRVGDGAGKTFIQQRPDGAGEWLDGLDGLAPVLYRLPELLAADPAQPVYIVEGEKCADELAGRGLVVTTNAGGALKWHHTPGARDDLWGRHVVILPDNDPEKLDKPHESRKGQRHAAEVAADLYGIAASVRVVTLPGLPVKGDVYDWLATGHTVDELQALAEVWPEWTPPAVPMMPQSQDSSRAMQDASSGETSTTCGACPVYASLRREYDRLREALRIEKDCRRIAETSLANLRRERALEDQFMAVSTDKMGAPEKLAYLALRRELTDNTHARNEQGLSNIPRAFIARRTGVKEQAAGAHLITLEERHLIVRNQVKYFDETVTYLGPTPLFDAPDAVEAPERAHSWGGARERKPRCPACKSTKLIATSYACEHCGCTATAKAAIAESVTYDLEMAAAAEEEAPSLDSCPAMQDASLGEGSDTLTPVQPDTYPEIQHHSSPLDMRVTHLESRVMDSSVVALSAAGMAHRRASAKRCQQQYELSRWAEEHKWAKLTYIPGTSTGGDEQTWERFVRQAGNEDIARAWAAISPSAAEAPGEAGLL